MGSGIAPETFRSAIKFPAVWARGAWTRFRAGRAWRVQPIIGEASQGTGRLQYVADRVVFHALKSDFADTGQRCKGLARICLALFSLARVLVPQTADVGIGNWRRGAGRFLLRLAVN